MTFKPNDRDLLAAVESTHKGLAHLFRRAVKRGTSKLEALLAADAIIKDGSQTAYHCIARDQYVHGHNHHEAERVAAGEAKPSDYQFFGNPLIIDTEGAGTKWTSPSSRATLGRHLIYTFEFDCAEPAFLREQCQWAMPLREPSKSTFGKLFRHLKRFADFRLLNVTYSGGKSLHIHLVFENALLKDRLNAKVSSIAVRAGYHAHWWLLEDVVMKELRPSGGIRPDDSLKTSTTLRRMPGGTRTVGDKHPLGLTAGSEVRQVVLWEQAVERNPAETVFHSPSLFTAKVAQPKPAGALMNRSLLTVAQLSHAEEWLREFYASTGLILSGIDTTNVGYVARFHNSPADANPASMLAEGFVTPILRGTDAGLVGTLPPLPLPFGQLLDHLAREVNQAKGFDAAALDVARYRLGSCVPYWITGNEISLIHAGEGVGKSTSIMRHIDLSCLTGSITQPSMFAFSTYEDAELKMREFNSRRTGDADVPGTGDEFVGVLWKSFSRLYADIAKGENLLTVEDADEAGTSLWALIRTKQPDVARAMSAQVAAMQDKIAGRAAVLFTVHQVAHMWRDNTFTRQMLCPGFFDDGFDAVASRKRTALNWLVHDEVSIETFVECFSKDQMTWLKRLKASGAKVWSSYASKRQRAAYDKFAEKNPGECAVPRAEARRAIAAGLGTFDVVVTADAEEYGFAERSLTPYACDGQHFYVHTRDWWMEGHHLVANRVTFLTTEAVPSLIAQKAVSGLVYLRPRSEAGRDETDVCAARWINADNATDIAQKYVGTATWVIANRLEGARHTVTPFAVRGRNDLAHADIVQIVTTFHPDHYHTLQGLGTWLERDDLALLAHVDQINQSSGRNRGPRNKGASHKVYINLTLFRAIMASPTARDELRYFWRLEMDEVQRKNARARLNSPANDEGDRRETA